MTCEGYEKLSNQTSQVSNNFRPFMSFNPILFYEGVYNGLTPAEHLHI